MIFPKIGQMLYITLDSHQFEEQHLHYKARVTDIHNETIEIEIPIEEASGVYTTLEPGTKLKVCFETNDKVKNYFYTEVLNVLNGETSSLQLEKPDANAITRNQRRKYLRVRTVQEIVISLTDDIRFLTKTNDLSGGGVSFTCSPKFPLAAGQSIKGWILLSAFKNSDQVDHIYFEGELVRVKVIDGDKVDDLEEEQIGMVKFKHISDHDREKIIRFCFDRQLESRK